MLHKMTYGHPTGEPALLVAHGLYGSFRNWGVIAKKLGDERQVVCVDMRNHGLSPQFDSHTYPEMAADLVEVIEAVGRPVDILGHSMGGKAAMVLALTRPDLVRKLIVADIAPVTYDGVDLTPIKAMKQVDMTRVERRADAAAQMDGIADDLKAFFLQSLDMKAKKWLLNLDVLARDMGEIRGFPPIDATFAGPTLFLAGALSDYIRDSDRARIKSLFPAGRVVKIPQADHFLQADRPHEVEAAIRAFLNA